MLFIANTFFEWELEGRLAGVRLKEVFSHHPFLRVLQYLPLLFANPQDGVLVTERPSLEYLETLKSYGIQQLPHLVTYEESSYRAWHEIQSWGASQIVASWAASSGLSYAVPPFEIVKMVNSKVWNFSKAPSLPYSQLVGSEADLKSALNPSLPMWVLKTDQGFSGSGHKVFTVERMDQAVHFSHKEWEKGRKLVLEPWVERVCDFSSQWCVDKKGLELIGVTKFFSTALGIYEGTDVGSLNELFGTDQSFIEEHLKIAESHLKSIVGEGFFGNIGIDAMLYKHPETGQTTLHPIVEVNARMTMSSAILKFHHRYRKVSKGRYFFQTQKNHVSGLLPSNSRKQLVIVD